MFIANEHFADFIIHDLLVDWCETTATEAPCYLPGFVRDACGAHKIIELLQDGETAYVTVAWSMITTTLDPSIAAEQFDGWNKTQHPTVYSVTRDKTHHLWEIHRGIA